MFQAWKACPQLDFIGTGPLLGALGSGSVQVSGSIIVSGAGSGSESSGSRTSGPSNAMGGSGVASRIGSGSY